jgi:hypothetical protein
MNEKFQYRLTQNQKNEIAQNLIDVLQKDAKITKETRSFICNWILTDDIAKRKAFFDVWEIVLRNYLPTTKPILFRSCGRISKKNKIIVSFTGRLECAKRFSKGKGHLIICDTKEQLEFENKFHKIGKYKNTFYPLVEVLVKARDSGGWGFSQRILDEYIGEDEYIMKINFENINILRWV